MPIVEVNKSGQRAAVSEVMTDRGAVVLEVLTPENVSERELRLAESRLYDVFSKYAQRRSDR